MFHIDVLNQMKKLNHKMVSSSKVVVWQKGKSPYCMANWFFLFGKICQTFESNGNNIEIFHESLEPVLNFDPIRCRPNRISDGFKILNKKMAKLMQSCTRN